MYKRRNYDCVFLRARLVQRDSYQTGHTDVTFIAVSTEIGVNYEHAC